MIIDHDFETNEIEKPNDNCFRPIPIPLKSTSTSNIFTVQIHRNSTRIRWKAFYTVHMNGTWAITESPKTIAGDRIS